MKPTSKIPPRRRRSPFDLLRDTRGLAATEFAVIAPVMLVAYFGTVEFCSAVAIDRKVTLTARTLSDITSRALAPIGDSYLQNVFTASIAIMKPYDPSPTNATVSEIYVDSTGVAKIQWSKAATISSGATQATLATSARSAGDVVTTLIPPDLLIKQTYLVLSEVSYQYVPTLGYVMAKTGVRLADVSYTRPRQVTCVTYNNLPAGNCPLN